MLLHEASTIATQLMSQHGLLDRGWYFEFDNARSRFGACHYGPKKITLSRQLVSINPKDQVVDTILHEIAHALTPGAHHGPVWKSKCIEIGAKPERCYTAETTNTVAGRYKAVCGGCGKTYERYKRLPRGRRQACRCQSHIKDWSKKKILEYKVARSNS